MTGSKNSTMVVSTKHHSKPAPNRSPNHSEFFSSEREAFWNFFNTLTLSYNLVAYMLIVVAILLVLAIVYKHVAKPSWIPSSQLMSEKFRLYMAGSMVGDFTRWIFNYWDNTRQDTVISNRDEKNRRLSDMSSSSSTSLSPSVLPTHNGSPRSYKKRPSTRQKTQLQNAPANSLSPIEDSPSPASSSSNDSLTEQSSTFTEKDDVTINVADTLNSRHDSSSIETCQENKGEIDKIVNNQNSSNTIKRTNENIDSWTESQLTQRSTSKSADLTLSESSMSSTNNRPSKLQKKNSLKGSRKRNSRNSKEQTVVLTTQESDGEVDSIISDDHSDGLIQQIDATVPSMQKHSTQGETFVKTGHKRRRRRTKGSNKNNQQKSQQNQQTQNLDQRSSRQEQPVSPQKRNIAQQSASDTSKSRHHHSNEVSKSRHSVEKAKTANYDIWERHSHQQHVEPHQPRSDQTVYFLHDNKRTAQIYNSANLNGTAVPAKATLPDSNRKATVFPRTDWKSPHASAVSHNFTSSNANVPISRFTTYADVIAPHNRSSRSNTSELSNGNNITTPVPAVSMNNTTNNQWYSPFGSGLSIQLTPPTSPQNVHRQLPSANSNVPSSTYSKQSQSRNRNVIAPPPSFSTSNNIPPFSSSSSSSLSMFTSSPFSSLSNQNQSNVITLPTNSLSFFGRKPVQDQEKGELSDEADYSEGWNKPIGISELTNKKTQNDVLSVKRGKFGEGTKNRNVSENVWHREQEPQQFSLFDSFTYSPK